MSRNLSPWKGLNQLKRGINHLFDDWDRDPWFEVSGMPAVVQEDEENYYIKVDLPGLSKDQIRVEAEDNRLTIYGERKEEEKKDRARYHLREVSYGSFARNFSLPSLGENKQIQAEYKAGVLSIKAPKANKNRTQEIEVRAG